MFWTIVIAIIFVLYVLPILVNIVVIICESIDWKVFGTVILGLICAFVAIGVILSVIF